MSLSASVLDRKIYVAGRCKDAKMAMAIPIPSRTRLRCSTQKYKLNGLVMCFTVPRPYIFVKVLAATV